MKRLFLFPLFSFNPIINFLFKQRQRHNT